MPTTLTDLDSTDITDSPETLALASDHIKAVVEAHNDHCPVKIKARVANGGIVEVTVCTKGGRAKKWHGLWSLTSVQQFAYGVSDAVKFGNNAPERLFATHGAEAAYFYGSVAGASMRVIDTTSGLPPMSAAERQQAAADASKRADEAAA